MKHNTMKVVLSLCLTIKNQKQEQKYHRIETLNPLQLQRF